MTCVIVDHSRISSLLSWFSYQRFWTVTAAEVFVVLSGLVLGMVYRRKLVRGDWRGVIRGLGRRALTLYASFLAVTLSVLAISLWGVDVSALTGWGDGSTTGFACFLDPPALNAGILANVALLRCGPWAFQIVGLYVWLVVAAVPCLMALHFGGWRPLLTASWILYVGFRFAPHSLTNGAFEETFPILPWQLLFVHGLAIGYYRDQVGELARRTPRAVSIAVGVASAAFAVFALCNPSIDGPSALHWSVVSPERFSSLYDRYFTLRELGVGRILNLAVALPVGYAALTRCWLLVRPLGTVFVTLGQQSLGAFVLHVYGLLLLSHVPLPDGAFWTGTVVQIVLVVAIAALLNVMQRVRLRRPAMTAGHRSPLTA